MGRIITVIVTLMLAGLVFAVPVSAASTLNIEFEVPDYTITSTGGCDYVEIPGGDILLEEEGRPRVPYYTYCMDLEKGWRAQEVTLVEKSEPESRQNLNLPLVVLQWTLTQPVEPVPGWYPDIEFEWNLVNRVDGGQTLDIVVYPVKYNPETGELLFYRNYSFLLNYVNSAVELAELSSDKPVYIPGETVKIDAGITNDGTSQDLYLDVYIRQYGSDELIDSLPVRLLKDVTGSAGASIEWQSAGNPEGSYYAEAVLTDISGNILDTVRAGFALGQSGVVFPTTSPATTTPVTTTTPLPGPPPTSHSNGLFGWIKGNLLYIGIGAGALIVVFILIATRHKAG
ncbi:MAG: hypothetical protein JW954_02380 [Dehalococcoidaceae bacterium]|nr:hypothetical protein [Dehalococcoidaceae bacterium]